MTVEELANHLVEGTFTRLHIKLKNWLEYQQEQDRTNKCFLKNGGRNLSMQILLRISVHLIY